MNGDVASICVYYTFDGIVWCARINLNHFSFSSFFPLFYYYYYHYYSDYLTTSVVLSRRSFMLMPRKRKRVVNELNGITENDAIVRITCDFDSLLS